MNLDNSAREKLLSDRLVSLVDIVFGVVFGLSIPTVFGSNTTLTIPKSFWDIATLSNTALFVAYIAIILSWVGYHKAMEQHPFKIGHGGTRRFFMDLAIVFLYAILIYSRNDLTLYLAIFPMIFVFYLLWDVTLNNEYGSQVTSQKITFKYFLIFLIMWFAYLYIGKTNAVSWIFLVMAFLLNFGFRHEKGTWRRS